MNIYKIYSLVLEKPDAVKFYKDLKEYYKNAGMQNEEAAFSNLINKKFKNDKKTNNPFSGEEQRENNREVH
jgi:hypothetical protein